MAVLGVGGRLELRREAASPCVILPEDVNAGNNSFDLHCEGYWPGDHITISGPDGLPIFIDGVPQCFDCVASYDQDVLFVAFNRDHIAGNDDDFYKQAGNPRNTYWRGDAAFANDDALFYYQGQSEDADPPLSDISGYICIDALGRVKLYEDRCEARACCGDPLFEWNEGGAILDFDFIVINHYGHSDYQNAITACFTEIGEYIFNDIAENDAGSPLFLTSICADAPRYLLPEAGVDEFDNADIQPRPLQMEEYPLWTVQCEVREYTLNLDAPSVDTTGVGEKWGNSVKSLVSGGGSIEFFIDRACVGEDQADSTQIMRLLLMTQHGAKAHAKFFLISNECATDCNPCPPTGCEQELRGSLWYESDIYITQNAINVRPTEMLAGSAQFVTTGEIKLLEGDSGVFD
jgi:hypothetical protein